MTMRQTILISAIFILLSSVSTTQATIRTVALSGQAAPNTPEGVNYSSFDPYYVAAGGFDPYAGFVRGPVRAI
jgi:hypothetical protein